MRNTKFIEVDLFSGVTTNADGYVVANKLVESKGFLPQRLGKRVLGSSIGVTFGLGVPIANAHSIIGGGLFENNALLFGRNNLGNFKAWDDSALTQYPGGTNRAIGTTGVGKLPAAWSYYPHGLGATYVGHPAFTGMYKISSLGNWADYSHVLITRPIRAFISHLTRLWYAMDLSSSETKIWYSRPLLPEIIDANSFEVIPDECRTLFTTSPSDVDLGAQSHLVFGGLHSFWVYDGEPQSGSGVLRALEKGIGVVSSSCVAQTNHGAVVLATDGQFYLIPPGAAEMIAIGNPILNKSVGFVGSDVTPALLLWKTPYLLYFPQTTHDMFVLDFSNPSAPSWWGPQPAHENRSLGAAILVKGAGGTSNVVLSGRTEPELLFLDDTLDGVPRKLKTGYIREEGHDVVPKKIYLFTEKLTSPLTVTVLVRNPHGVTETRQLAAEITVGSDDDKIARTAFQVDISTRARGDWFQIEISCDNVDPQIRKIIAEYRAIPRQY